MNRDRNTGAGGVAAVLAGAVLLSACESGSTTRSADLANSGADGFAYLPYATGQGEILLVDPTQPAAPATSVAGPTGAAPSATRIVPFGNYSSLTGGLERTQNQALLILEQGRLFAVTLSARQITRRQLSAADNLCAFRNLAINHVGRPDSRAIMVDSGDDARCGTQDDNRLVAIPFGAGVTDTPLVLSADFALRNQTYNTDGSLRSVIASDVVDGAPVLNAYAPDLASAQPVLALEALAGPRNVFGGSIIGLRQSFMRLRPAGGTADQLVVVSDGDSGYTVTPVYDFKSPQAGALVATMSTDDRFAFFRDREPGDTTAGGDVYRVSLADPVAGATLIYEKPDRFDITAMRMTRNHLVLQQRSNDGSDLVRLVSVPKTGGAPIELDVAVGGVLSLQAAGSQAVYYTVRTAEGLAEARVVSADGSERRALTNARFSGRQLLSGLVIEDAGAPAPSPASSVLVKVSDDSELSVAVRAAYTFLTVAETGGARLFAVDLEKGLPGIELGRVAGARSVSAEGFGALALLQVEVLRDDGSIDSDLYTANVTRAGSLAPVATTVGLDENTL